MNDEIEDLFKDIQEFRINLLEFKNIMSQRWEDTYNEGFDDGYQEGYDDDRD